MKSGISCGMIFPYLWVDYIIFMDYLKHLTDYFLCTLLLCLALPCHAQLFSIGYKQNKAGMFHTTFNYPFVFDNDKPYEIMLGADYTTKNKHAPSGLAPQATLMYHIDTGRQHDHLISIGAHTGYLFDFNKQFNNQTRLTPFVYLEYLGIFNVKVGYDYMLPLNKGYPYLSIGIGGLLMFKDFHIM